MKYEGRVTQYTLFRVLLGGYLFVHFAYLIPWAPELFSREGMLPIAGASPIYQIIPSVFGLGDGPGLSQAVVVAGAAASFLLIVGRHDRVAALVLWYLLACLLGRNPLISNPALPYVGWMLLAHAFMVTKDGRIPRALFVAAWVVMAASYSYSGYTKLLSPSWEAGNTVWYVLQNPLARDYFVRDTILSLGEEPIRILTRAIMWIEVLFAPLALFRIGRPIAWAMMAGVQVGFLFLLNFADLTVPMLLFHLLTFDGAWLAAFRWPEIRRAAEVTLQVEAARR